MSDLLKAADAFAASAHGSISQVRRYTGEPYISHPRAVAEIVMGLKGTTLEMIAASLLHDVVEDTPRGLDEIRQLFGNGVADHVDDLTDKATLAMGNRAFRKRFESARLSQVTAGSQTIKVADSIHNLEDFLKHDLAFARVALAEKQTLLDQMQLADAGLRDRAYRLIESGWRQLAYV